MSVSWWQRVVHQPERLEADVCIIGAGIAGLCAADEAARLGLSVVVLERHAIGAGASTRNAGFLMRGMAESYAVAARELGRERARDIWRLSEDNLRLLIDRFGIDALPSFQRIPSSLVAVDDDEAADLRASADMLREDGFRVEMQTEGSDTLWRNRAPSLALVNPDDAAINPSEMIERIAGLVAEHPAVQLIEQAEVYRLRQTESGVIVRARGAEVIAGRLLVCTNAYAGELIPELLQAVRPNRGQMLAIRHPSARLDASYYLDHGSEYIRQITDGTIVVGGMRKRFADEERTSEDRTTNRLQAELQKFAEDLLGGSGDVVARWAGTMGFTDQGLPLIRPIELLPEHDRATGSTGPGDPIRGMFCGGFTGHGMSIGAATAIKALRTLVGQPASAADDDGADPG